MKYRNRRAPTASTLAPATRTRPWFRHLVLFAALTSLLNCSSSEPRPDVIVLTLDTLNLNYTPMAGRTDLMPALKELLDESASFPVAHTQVPLTLPSHTSMFSGQSPLDHGVLLNSFPVPANLPLLAEQMKEAGYETAAFVSFGVLGPETGIARGFDTYDLGPAEPHRYRRAPDTLDKVTRFLRARTREERGAPLFLWVHLVDPHLPYLERDPQPEVRILAEDDKTIAELTLADQALHRVELPAGSGTLRFEALGPVTERIRRRLVIEEVLADEGTGERNLLNGRIRLRAGRAIQELNVPNVDSIRVRGQLVSRGRRDILRRYESEVRLMDEGIDALRRAVAERSGTNTIWAVATDHGEGCFEHGINGHAAHAWEEQLATLFAFRLPTNWSVEPPQRSDLPRAQVEDLAPTMLDLLGIDRPESKAFSHASCLLSGTNCRDRSRWAAYAARKDGSLSAAAVYDWPLKALWRVDEVVRCHDLVLDPEEQNPLDLADPACAAQARVVENFRALVEPLLSSGADPANLTPEQRRMLQTLGYL